MPDGIRTLDLVGAGNGVTADRVALTPGSGYFVQTVGQEPGSPMAGSLFWVSDTGVRYGIEPGENDQTIAALGLSAPPSRCRGRSSRSSPPARRCRGMTPCSPTTP